jgi:Photosynthesis system II assembly factor YCF48
MIPPFHPHVDGAIAMLFMKNGGPVARLLARTAVCFGAAAVVLTGCAAGSVAQQATAGRSTSAAGSSQAAPGGWRTENSGTRQRLYDVACLSALRCEAVGAAGTIVATVNGGRTWRAQANPLRGSSTPLYQITCVAPSTCYVIARPNTILVTHNGGASWSRHVLSVGVSGNNLTDQACLPGYAPISGRPAECRLGLLDTACISASVCYAISTAPLAYDVNPIPKTSAPSSVWLTRNGGATWSRQSIPPGVPCDGDCQPGIYGYPLEWVSCLSSGLCRAGGGHVLDCGHCGFAYAVLATRGPGTPWTCTSAGCATVAPDAAVCPTSARCYGVQSTNPFGGPTGGVNVLRSTNGGANWDQIGPAQGWPSVLNDIACPATLTCYLAGSHGSIAKITNGTTVTAQRTPTVRDLYGIGCTCSICYAVGDKGTILAN